MHKFERREGKRETNTRMYKHNFAFVDVMIISINPFHDLSTDTTQLLRSHATFTTTLKALTKHSDWQSENAKYRYEMSLDNYA